MAEIVMLVGPDRVVSYGSIALKDGTVLVLYLPVGITHEEVNSYVHRLAEFLDQHGRTDQPLLVLVGDEGRLESVDEGQMARIGWFRAGKCPHPGCRGSH